MNGHATAYGDLVGVVSAVPARVITNADCPDPAAAFEAAALTGVNERRWALRDQTSAHLCTVAARDLLRGLSWSAAEVDVLIYVTQTPESVVPADVYRMAQDLGLPGTAACLQVNWSCAGYVYGLWLAMRLLQAGQRALLLVGDVMSTVMDPRDRATAPLFGDAGSATAIVGGGREQRFVMGSDGRGADHLAQQPDGYLRMHGAEVFTFALRRVPELIADVLALGRPDLLLFHQANRYMLSHLIKRAKLLDQFESEQIPMNIGEFGNCSCASIPLLMCSSAELSLRALPNRLALFGFGAGWAWCGASIQCDELQVVDLLEV